MKGETAANNRVTNNVCVCVFGFLPVLLDLNGIVVFVLVMYLLQRFLFVYYTSTNLHNATDAAVIGRDFYLSDDDDRGWVTQAR